MSQVSYIVVTLYSGDRMINEKIGNRNSALYKSAVTGSATLSISAFLLLTSTDVDKPYLLSNPAVLSIFLAGSVLALIASIQYSYFRGHRIRQHWMTYDEHNRPGEWITVTPSNEDDELAWEKRQAKGLVISLFAAVLLIATASYAIDIGSDSLDNPLDKTIFATIFGAIGAIGVAMALEFGYTMDCGKEGDYKPKTNVLAKLPDTIYTMSGDPKAYTEYSHGQLYAMRVGSGALGFASMLSLFIASLNQGNVPAPMLDGPEPAVFRLFFAGALFMAWGLHQYSYVLKSKEPGDAAKISVEKTSFLGPSTVSFGMAAACFMGMILTAMAKKIAEPHEGSFAPDLGEIMSFAGVYGVGGGALLIGSLFMAKHSFERAKDVVPAAHAMNIN